MIFLFKWRKTVLISGTETVGLFLLPYPNFKNWIHENISLNLLIAYYF